MFESKREARLVHHLMNHVHEVRCEPGLIEFRPEPQAPADLAPRLADLLGRWKISVQVPVWLGAAVVIACVSLTWRQVGHWHDSRSLWQHTLAVTQNNYRAHLDLARELEREGNLEAAGPHYVRAAQINPFSPFPHFYLGLAYQKDGRSAQCSHSDPEASRSGSQSKRPAERSGITKSTYSR